MKIWVIDHYADPPEGMATRSFDIARRMVQGGHPTSVFVSNFSHYFFRNQRRLGSAKLWHAENIEGVCFVWIRTASYRRNDWRRVLNMISFTGVVLLAGLVRREHPEVVIGVSVHPLAALAGYFLARLKRARFFLQVTDLWPQTLIDFGRLRPDSFTARTLQILERFLFRQAERIVMLWRHTDQYVESRGVSRDKVLWIPSGVELSRYEGLKPYTGRASEAFCIMWMGAFVASNSLETIVDTARLLQDRGRRDITFTLIGAGTLREDVRRWTYELALNNIRFLPALPKSELYQAMSQADAFIYALRDMPLYKYGISLNKLTDYLVSGRPIVFSGNSTYDPVAEVKAGFSVPAGDVTAVADAIERLVDLTPEERADMGSRGRQYALEYHNIPKLATRLLEAMATIPG